MRHYKIIAKGKVQGVGFRNFTKRFADNNNLKGSVKNLTDGNVEIFISLPKANGCNLDILLESLKQGNGRMDAKSFEIIILDNLDFKDFQVL